MMKDLQKSKRLKSEYTQLMVPLLAIALLLIFNLLRDPRFFSISLIVNNSGNKVFAGNLISILSIIKGG